MDKPSAGPSAAGSRLQASLETLLEQARLEGERRRQATERRMEEIHHRLKHVAYLVADLDLRCVIPRLTELASLFPNAVPPRKKGFDDRIWVDFAPTPAYPAQARLTVGMRPNPSGDVLRVSVSVVLVPVNLPYEHEAWLDLQVASPDTKGLEDFLDERIVQFVKDYLRTGGPDSPCHEGDLVTDPVCRSTFPRPEAASSLEHHGRPFYFCTEGCRKKFEATPERYLAHPPSLKDMPLREVSPMLQQTPAEMPREPALAGLLPKAGGRVPLRLAAGASTGGRTE